MDFEETIKEAVFQTVKETGLKKEDIVIEKPKQDFGDYAFPCFSLSKILKKSPLEIAKDLEKKIKLPKVIVKVIATGPYLNFFVDRGYFAEQIISKILKEKDNFGKPETKERKKEKVMVEFSQANTHKAFHVGHIRGTSLGESISRISEFLGNDVTRANYQGDIGMHVAKWLWCYQTFHKKEWPKKMLNNG
jgi:arginyl-tRNA synthetase